LALASCQPGTDHASSLVRVCKLAVADTFSPTKIHPTTLIQREELSMSVLDDREFFRLAALADSSFLDIDLAPWASAAEKQLLNLRDIPAVRSRGASLDTWTWWWAHVAGVGKGAGVCTVQCLWAWMRVELGLGIRHDGARTSIRNRGGGLGGRTRDRTRRCEVRRRFGRRNERTRGNIRSQSVGQGVRRRHAWKDSGRARGPSRIGLWW
jgi:hypothetical protein